MKSKIHVYNWGMADNPFIPRSEIEELRRTLSPRAAKMRLEGEYVGSELMVFPSFDPKIHIKPNLYRPTFPVSVSIDWGIVCISIGFYQYRKITNILGQIRHENYMIDAIEMEGAGYSHVMQKIYKIRDERKYFMPPDEWYCDPAGRARSQATKTGISLLKKIENDYGVKFRYLKKLGVEESIELVEGWFMNAKGDTRFYIQEGIKLNDNGDTPTDRIEGYVRDPETHQPVKDGVNDHFNDQIRYYIANQIISETRGKWKQS